MSLFHLFRRGEREEISEKTNGGSTPEEHAVYSGMRVEVTTPDERLLFVAKLQGLQGNRAQLYQYSETKAPTDRGSLSVKIRGYSDHEKKAVYMEGNITPQPEHIWQVEDLVVTRIENARAFFRLTTDLDATVTTFSGLGAGEKPCKLLNISVGGACIGSEYQYHKGDKFLLKVRLLEDRPESAMLCQVLRITGKENTCFEYGCQFLELTEEDQKAITQNIFAAQRKKRSTT